jgi:hypothetical protein
MSLRSNGARPLELARADLAERLYLRRFELEAAICARVRESVTDPATDGDIELVVGLEAAVDAFVEDSLTSIERNEPWSGSLPADTLEQARRAARMDVSLSVVLRRYLVGNALLREFVLEEVEQFPSGQQIALLLQVSEVQHSLLADVVGSIAEEYSLECEHVIGASRPGADHLTP